MFLKRMYCVFSNFFSILRLDNCLDYCINKKYCECCFKKRTMIEIESTEELYIKM